MTFVRLAILGLAFSGVQAFALCNQPSDLSATYQVYPPYCKSGTAALMMTDDAWGGYIPGQWIVEAKNNGTVDQCGDIIYVYRKVTTGDQVCNYTNDVLVQEFHKGVQGPPGSNIGD